jgi:hypothetical protein
MRVLAVFFLLPITVFAAEFTTVGNSGKLILAGVKHTPADAEATSTLVRIDPETFERHTHELPPELKVRELRALVPLDAREFLVISQRTTGGGDNPRFHAFDPASGAWRSLGELHCASFSKLEFSPGKVEARCLEVSDEGKEVTRMVETGLPGTQIKGLSLGLPVSEAKSNKVTAVLLGRPFAWKELRVTSPKGTKVISPE